MPRAPRDFNPLDPASLETATFTFDFSSMLGMGETILTATWTMQALNGLDQAPSSRLAGSPQISGNAVLQSIGTCVAGEQYRILATVTTSAAQTLTLYAHCQCITPA
jgi:hypothetical protein